MLSHWHLAAIDLAMANYWKYLETISDVVLETKVLVSRRLEDKK